MVVKKSASREIIPKLKCNLLKILNQDRCSDFWNIFGKHSEKLAFYLQNAASFCKIWMFLF
jgi:hypothetical protein